LSELAKPEKIAQIESIRGHEVDSESARTSLKTFLSDADDDVRAEAAAAVWEFPDDATLVEETLKASVEDKAPRVRAKAITALGRIVYEGDVAGADQPNYVPDPLLGDPPADLFAKVRDHLFKLAGDDARPIDERRFAIEALGFLGDDARVHELIGGFWGRSEPAAKLSAVFAMGRSGHPRWEGAIREALGSADSELKLQAIWAAGEAEVVPARDALLALAKSGPRDQRLAAIESIARLGGETVGSTLLEMAEKDGDPEIREAAALGLEELALLDAIDQDAGDEDDGDAGADDDQDA
jgi:HEAT repeat protein